MKNQISNTSVFKSVVVIIFSLVMVRSFGQSQTLVNLTALNDSVDTLSNAKLNHVLRNEFTLITSPKNVGSIGNYVSLVTDDNTLAFSYNFVKNYSVLEIGASGGVTENIFSLISNSSLNTGVGLSFKYHGMIKGFSKVSYDVLAFDAIAIQDYKLTKKFDEGAFASKNNTVQMKLKEISKNMKSKQEELATLEKHISLIKGEAKGYFDAIRNEQLRAKEVVLIQDSSLIEKQIVQVEDIIKSELTELKDAYNKKTGVESIKKQQFVIDSIKITQLPLVFAEKLKEKKKELKKLRVLIVENKILKANEDKLVSKLTKATYELELLRKDSLHMASYPYSESTIQGNQIVKEFNENDLKLNNIRAEEIKLTWLTLGGDFSYESFKLFNRTLPMEDQIFNKKAFTPSFKFAITHYVNKLNLKRANPNARRIEYFEFATAISYGNNIKGLSKLNIETTDSISPNRTIVNSASAYNFSEFEPNQITGQLTGDYYRFVGDLNNIGFHWRGVLDFSQKDFPMISSRLGIIFSALDRSDKSSIINFELFFGLNNIFKNNDLDQDEKVFDRNVFGLQTTLPFNLKTN